ncbi:MAG: tRNA (guanosine(46)-N7)-methyltransferase TrmB [Bacteroidetes bacterium]|nr:tRNA (guanosine(46)-N7)-methyltransferase TrmB [Bacteroidota bacterium]
MGKNKLKRWADLLTMERVFQPNETVRTSDFELKGKWNEIVFCNHNPIVLELGCGRGEYTIGLANEYKQKNFIGIDIKGARLWRGARTANDENILNAAFLRTRIETIVNCFGANEISELWITFPDPQPGDREHKRLTNPRFILAYKKFLCSNGIIHLKSDDQDFFDYSTEILKTFPGKFIFHTSDLYKDITNDKILSIKTTYEGIWLAKGKKIGYLSFQFE